MSMGQSRLTWTRGWHTVVLGALATIFSSACDSFDSLLEVDVPGALTTEDVYEPRMAETVVNGVVGRFECGFSSFIPGGSGREDAWWRTSALYGGYAQYQVEHIGSSDACDGPGDFYMGFQMSRYMGEEIYARLQNWTDQEVSNRERLMAITATYVGLDYQIFGEVFCEIAVNNGPAMTPQQALQAAEDWFDRALGHIANTGDFELSGVTTSMEQLVLLGRARVRFAMGDNSGATSDASQIQPGFIAWVSRDATIESRYNQFYAHHNVQTHGSIAGPQPDRLVEGDSIPFTGYRDLTIDAQGFSVIDGMPVKGTGTPDPRVPVQILAGNMGLDGQTQMYVQTKYQSYGDPIPLARWAEAQLILAEIEGGQSAVDRINALRDVYALPHLVTTDPDVIAEHLIEEWRREFFLEGRFWHVKLEKDLWFPYGFGLAVPERRGNYGMASCQLMPQSEYDNNPNLRGRDGEELLRARSEGTWTGWP